ncbi:fibrinogen-like protein A [Mytilus trossulus]|uniref:fibrinogen-like protein A n=1 Tax=Mytilus trossulus TaxID=6551 RepID=UPI003005ECA6
MLRMLTRDVKTSGVCKMTTATDCTELQKYISHSDVYPIYPDKSEVKVYCDMTTDGGGWTIIQRRLDGTVNFQRSWKDCENGFGNVDSEYWLGNKHIHSLTSSGKYELRIDLTDLSNTKKYAVYKTFIIGDAASKYKLTVGEYSGNAGDQMTYHNGMKFSSTDQGNDEAGGSCVDIHGPWWHKSCCYSALNRKLNINLYWRTFSSNAAKTSVMMIRKL